MRRGLLLTQALVLLLLVSACGQRESQVHDTQLLVFGTLVNVTIWGGDEDSAAAATSAVEQRLMQMHRDLHAWQPGPLTRANQAIAVGDDAPISAETAMLIQRGAELSRQSGGLFNPSIGSLIGLWGFHSDDGPHGPPPEDAGIRALLAAAPSMTNLHVSDGRLSSDNPTVQLDFGGFAKGYAVDEAIRILREHHIENAIVNAGGDLRVIGRHGGRSWRIGIRDPRGPGVIASVEVSGDESVFTSGDYERYFEYQGLRYHHIIDPRSGYPATGSSSVTILSKEAIVADAAATALFVAGPKAWLKTATAMGIDQAMLIDDQGQVYMTPAMATRTHFEVDPQPPVKIVSP